MNVERFYKYLDGFKKYIESMSNEVMLDLSSNKFFLEQEGYKHDVYRVAQNILDCGHWSADDIGTGKIALKVSKAVNEADNLVYYLHKIHFNNKIKENKELSERVLYNIYCSDNDAKSFDDAVDFFGGRYDLLAYLFFIKDDEKYLPISSSNFDERFEFLSIPLKTSRNCSSSNYFEFVRCIDELRAKMEEYYGFTVSLLDAHSVIWQLDLANQFVAKAEEKNADTILSTEVNDLLPKKEFKATGYSKETIKRAKPIYSNGHKVYPRSRAVALNAMYIAKNSCEINPLHESFIRKNSDEKYMEPHHLVPMSQSEAFDVSLDREQNIICLCSNCHNEIHYGKHAKELVSQLFEARKELLKSVDINISLDELLSMY